MKTILIATAITDDAKGQIRTDRFIPIIEKAISDAGKTNEFEQKLALAASKDDFIKKMELTKPNILHLIGHGDKLDRFVFENKGLRDYADPKTFAEVIHTNAHVIDCVVVSACHSEELAKEIAKKIQCAVGYDGALNVDVAKTYCEWFYFYLASGNTFDQIDQMLKSVLIDKGIKQDQIPKMFINNNIQKPKPMVGKILEIQILIREGEIGLAINLFMLVTDGTKFHSTATAQNLSYKQYEKKYEAGLDVRGELEGITMRFTETFTKFRKEYIL